MIPHATTDFRMSDGASIGFLFDDETRIAVSHLVTESRAPLPEGKEKTGAWLRMTQRHAAGLAECARWVCVPARRAGDWPLNVRESFVAGLTLSDAMTLKFAVAALLIGKSAEEARAAYALTRPEVPNTAAADHLPLAALVENPARMFS